MNVLWYTHVENDTLRDYGDIFAWLCGLEIAGQYDTNFYLLITFFTWKIMKIHENIKLFQP